MCEVVQKVVQHYVLSSRHSLWFLSFLSSQWHCGVYWGRPSPPPTYRPHPPVLDMDNQGAVSTPGKASGLKPPSKIARPSGVPSKMSPPSGKELFKIK